MNSSRKGGSLRTPGVPGDARLLEEVQRKTSLPSVGMEIRHVHGGVIQRPFRARNANSANLCPFGKIITIPAEGETPAGKAIKGGIVIGGDQNWNILPNTLNLAATGEYLVWLEVGVTANNEDSLPLPGLVTSTAPTWQQGTVAAGYPATVQPEISNSFIGTAIVPLGTLTIADGAATFARTGCGNVTIGYCPTNLSISRS